MWLDLLNDEDLTFIKRFVLASGSLKKLARDYGISYPTVRLRLDRIIEKVKITESHRQMSQFEQVVRGLYTDGNIDMQVLKSLLNAHQKECEDRHEKQNPDL